MCSPEVTKRSSIIKVRHCGVACVRILRSPRAIWFYWSTNVARARSGTLLKCYAQSQNARNSDSGELRNACPNSKNFSIPANMVRGHWNSATKMDLALSLALSHSPLGEIRCDSIALPRLLVIFVSDKVAIIQWIPSLVHPRLTAFVALSRYRRCCDKRSINIGAIVAKSTQTTVGFRVRHIADPVK